METSLATLIEKNQDRLVDKAATSLKVMFGVAYADVAQEDLAERLYKLFDAMVEITKKTAPAPDLIDDIAESVMISPVYAGWDNKAMTEEVLQVVDMVINKQIETSLSKPEQAEDKKNSQDLLALTIRTAKEVVNGEVRHRMEDHKRKRERWPFLSDDTGRELDNAEKSLRMSDDTSQ